MANCDRTFTVLDEDCSQTASAPLPRVRRGASNDERSNPSLSLKWEDFFGTSLDLTSGILNALDTITTDVDIRNSVCQQDQLEDYDELNSVANHNFYFNEDFESHKESNRVGCSSPTDIILLNALPTIPRRNFIGGCRSSATVPAVINSPSSTMTSAFTTFPRTLRSSSAAAAATAASAARSANNPQQQLGMTSKLMESGYVSEETMLAAVGCAALSGAALRNEFQAHNEDNHTAVVNGCTANDGGSDGRISHGVPETACTVPSSLVTLDKASRVLQELVETERSYVSDLYLLVQGYMEPMLRNEALFVEKSVCIIFGVLPDLSQFHQDFLLQLDAAASRVLTDDKGGYSAVAQCFLDNRQRFHHYSQYCTNFPRSLSHLQELLSNVDCADFLTARQKALQQMLPLQTFLLKPVQRILKYHLLLQNLVKVLGQAEPELEKAALCMTNVAAHINELQRRHEHTMRVRQLQSLLKSAHLDLGALGELVLEDTFRLCGKKGARQVFLFDKAMLSGKRLENGMLVIKEVIRCANLMLIESIPKEPLSFHVLPFDNPKAQQTLQARTVDQKTRWCQQIKRLILDNYNTAIPEKAKNLVLNMSSNVKSSAAAADHKTQLFGFGEFNSSSLSHDLDEELPQCCGEDLLTLHEEAWQELLRRNVHTCEHDSSISSSSSQNSDLVLYDDLRCLAVEINEERLSDFVGAPLCQDSTVGLASNILRATINSTLNYKSSTASAAAAAAASMSLPSKTKTTVSQQEKKVNDAARTVAAASSESSSSHNPVYIHCPLRYDHLVFGKAYHEYIEKTMTMTALSPSDIDDIFKPLRELHVDVKEDATAADSSIGAVIASSSQPSSAESSPRHIVSRIATSSSNAVAAVGTRIIQVMDSQSEVAITQQQQTTRPACGGGNEISNGAASVAPTRQRKCSVQTEKPISTVATFARSHSTSTPPEVPLSSTLEKISIRSTPSTSVTPCGLQVKKCSTLKTLAPVKVVKEAGDEVAASVPVQKVHTVARIPNKQKELDIGAAQVAVVQPVKCKFDQAATKNTQDEPAEAPRRGTVANMISRFQYPT